MNPHPSTLDLIVIENPNVVAAWINCEKNPSKLIILNSPKQGDRQIQIPRILSQLETELQIVPQLKILRCPVTRIEATNDQQECQNEPIKLGTQIQPEGANWLGTAGAPIKWLDSAGLPHWGILSNWHVLADGGQFTGRTCHQPTTDRAACAKLTAWSEPNKAAATLIDAAIADALIDGAHTISRSILGIGDIGTSPLDASVGLPVSKSGRTTGVTRGKCTATGASVRVGYGNFNAVLSDQDVFTGESGEFSAAGDSGSLIVERETNRPVSLLFAGGGNLTIGNAFRHVVAAFNLVFPFN